MTLTEEDENYNSLDNEQNDLFDDYPHYLIPEYLPSGEESPSTGSIHPRWKKTPRTAADFSSSRSSISSCGDSDYEAWLENYYKELLLEKTKRSFCDKQVGTSVTTIEDRKEAYMSMLPEIKKDPWSRSTKYWGPRRIRRHWPLSKKRNELLLFPSIHPHLNLRSRYGRYLSLINSAAAVPEVTHKSLVCSTFKRIIQGLVVSDPQLKSIMICDSLCNIKWFDYMTKTTVVRCLCKFLRTQHTIEKVYFENTDFRRLEGIILLCALSRNGGGRIKELHMWKMFGYGQCPVLLSELAEKGPSTRESETTKFFTKTHYLQILYNFSVLTHLSINYAYLANRDGKALLFLKSVRNGYLKELRLLCLKDERPFLTNPGYGVGGWSIPDGVWRRVVDWCPDLRVKFVFLNLPEYENVIVFLSKSIPVSYVYLSAAIDFTFRVPWDLDSTLLEMRNWYAKTLETLCLHLWHHRDLLDYVIKFKILEEFPNLLNFEFIGILEDVETLDYFCCQLSKGTYKLKSLLFWVEDQHTGKKKKLLTRQRVAEIRQKFHRRFQVVDIEADIQTYAL